ncbi:MAG: GNAT family N-acetyltransferase [Beijerinckiaceae bacterium]
MFTELTRDDVFRIETKRLWLRWPRHQDAAQLARLAGDMEVAEMTGTVPHPYPHGAAETFIFEARKGNATGQSLQLAITPRNRPDQLIGVIGSRVKPHGLDLGYWLGKPHWGEGLATEAAQALIDAVFSYTEVKEVRASARVINPASRSVIEKCGFQFVGSDMADAPARGGRVAVDRFRLPRATWASLKSWRAPVVGGASARAEKAQPELCA